MATPAEIESALSFIVADEFADLSNSDRSDLAREHTDALQGSSARKCWVQQDAERALAGIFVEGSIAGRAWLLGLTRSQPELNSHAAALLSQLESQVALEAGPNAKLRVGGPPGSYLRSGVAIQDTRSLDWFMGRGYEIERRHVDLLVELNQPTSPDPRVRRALRTEREPLLEWISQHFAPAWKTEAARALDSHDAVFVSGSSDAYIGFSAHSGNNACVGTFGPLGVVETSRRSGLGAALARATLDDQWQRGFRRVTIPWVDPALAEFYRRLVARVEVIDRVVLAKML